MKTTFSILAVAAILFTSCEKDQMPTPATKPVAATNQNAVSSDLKRQNTDQLLETPQTALIGVGVLNPFPKSQQEVLDMHLDVKYGIPSDIYAEFTSSLTFDETGFRGCIYEGISSYLDVPNANQFWSALGVQMPTLEGSLSIGGNIFQGYKPKTRGCKANSRWICTIAGDVVI